MSTEEYQIEETSEPETTPKTAPAEEKKSDLVEVLEDMTLGLEEIPAGWDKEKVKQVLAEHLKFEKEEKERKAQELKLSEMDKAQKEQIKILSARRPRELSEFETPTPEYLEQKQNWEKYQKANLDYENERQRRQKTNIPQGVPQKTQAELQAMGIKERTKYFEKLGLVKKPFRP